MSANLPLRLDERAPGDRPARLSAANINPKTGLATDYLNHFNEAIMLLDLLPQTPEVIVELVSWEPLSYQEHFAGLQFQGQATSRSPPTRTPTPIARVQLDELADAMNALLVATCEAFQNRASLDDRQCRSPPRPPRA